MGIIISGIFNLSFVLGGVPICIFVCNYIFGLMYDSETAAQKGLYPATSIAQCVGESCFSGSYKIFTGLQIFTVLMALALVLQGFREAKFLEQFIPSEDLKMISLFTENHIQPNSPQIAALHNRSRSNTGSLVMIESNVDEIKTQVDKAIDSNGRTDEIQILYRVPSLAQISVLNTSHNIMESTLNENMRLSVRMLSLSTDEVQIQRNSGSVVATYQPEIQENTERSK